MLRAENPGADTHYPIFIVDLRHAGYGCEDLIQQPDYGKDDGQRGYSFVLGGFLIGIYVASRGHLPPDPIDKFCLKASGDFVLIVADAKPILEWWATRLKGTGKL